jgi:hemolysin III
MDLEKAESFNLMISLPGVVAAPLRVALLLELAIRLGDPWKIVSFSIYGVTLMFLYAISTLDHAIRGRGKQLLRELDYCAIYLFIAGTYTAFSLVPLRGAWGWTLCGLVWACALFGILLGKNPHGLSRIPELSLYLGMGWLILIAIRPLMHAVPWQGVAWLGIGGVFYTGGIFFFSLDNRVALAHGLWHLCVLAGGISHYMAILLYIT